MTSRKKKRVIRATVVFEETGGKDQRGHPRYKLSIYPVGREGDPKVRYTHTADACSLTGFLAGVLRLRLGGDPPHQFSFPSLFESDAN